MKAFNPHPAPSPPNPYENKTTHFTRRPGGGAGADQSGPDQRASRRASSNRPHHRDAHQPAPETIPSLPVAGDVSLLGTNAPAATNTTASTTNTSPENELMDSVTFDDDPLPDAIRQLAIKAGINIQFDHRLELLD